ncbi:MAG: hypothetical protein ACJ74O_01510 [Frankiaceae bacterium]
MLLRGAPRDASPAARLLLLAGILVGAAMVVVSAAIHLHLWSIGYKHIRWIGPSFLLQSISGFALALVLVTWRRLVAVALAAGFLASSIVALLLSATVGFLGLHDGLDVPWADWSLASEAAGLVVLLACGAAMLRGR